MTLQRLRKILFSIVQTEKLYEILQLEHQNIGFMLNGWDFGTMCIIGLSLIFQLLLVVLFHSYENER